ncbi:MAG TPA: hypothetical protein VFK37_03595 [Bacillales bacterium]|nr:hypothetical protein [Bacillales bacterium]
MKKLLILVIVLGVLAGGGYYGYAKVKNYAANKMLDEVASHLSKQENASLKKDPQVQAVLKNAGSSAKSAMTKEKAAQLVESKFSAADLKDMVKMASGGFTAEEKAQIKAKFESKFTPKELKELKVVALKQLQDK